MKKLIYLLFFISFASFGQVPKKSKGQTSSIDVKGNNNVIKVIQGDGIKIYDLKDETQYQSFLKYLKAIPQINKELKEVLAYDKKTFDLVSKLVEKTQEYGVFDPTKFLEEFAKKVEEITKLKIENEALRKQTKDEELAQILEKANKLLETFDSKGYQQILEDFKQKRKEKVKKEQNEIAQVAFLQGADSRINNELDKALEQLNEALTLDPSNGKYLNHIGSTYYAKGDYDKALEFYQKAVTINEKVLGKEHPSIALAYSDIGLTYDNKGDYDKALKYYQKAVTILENNLGKEHPITAIFYSCIGTTYDHKGDDDKSLEYHQKAVTINEKVLGKKHPLTASSYNNIGSTYGNKGDYDKALEYHQKAVTIRENVFGKEHRSTAESYNNIGLLYIAKGDYDKALEYHQKAVTIYEKVLGKEHTSTARSYNNIGSTYGNKGNYDKALEYYQKAVTILENILGKEHPSAAESYNNIGITYDYKGDYDKALEYHQKAVTIYEKVLGKEHPSTANSYKNVGLLYIAKGEKDKGIAFFKKTRFGNKSEYEKTKIITIIGVEAFKRNQFLAAINFYNLALEFLQKSNKAANDKMYIILYNNLANAYCYNGDKEKALSLFKQSITLGKQTTMNLEEILSNYEECKKKL